MKDLKSNIVVGASLFLVGMGIGDIADESDAHAVIRGAAYAIGGSLMLVGNLVFLGSIALIVRSFYAETVKGIRGLKRKRKVGR